jgi:hypothetical protein
MPADWAEAASLAAVREDTQPDWNNKLAANAAKNSNRMVGFTQSPR